MKKMQELEDAKNPKKKKASAKGVSTAYPASGFQGNTGFHAKSNSQIGAERQRSMGNRMSKSS